MLDIIIFALIASALTALVYELKLIAVTVQLEELLDKLDELNDLATDPPFNLVDEVRFTPEQIAAWQ